MFSNGFKTFLLVYIMHRYTELIKIFYYELSIKYNCWVSVYEVKVKDIVFFVMLQSIDIEYWYTCVVMPSNIAIWKVTTEILLLLCSTVLFGSSFFPRCYNSWLLLPFFLFSLVNSLAVLNLIFYERNYSISTSNLKITFW